MAKPPRPPKTDEQREGRVLASRGWSQFHLAGGPDLGRQQFRFWALSQGAGDSATTLLVSRHHGDLTVGLACWPYDDFHVLPERREKVHEAFYGKNAGAVAH
jgi:hypothetical protein